METAWSRLKSCICGVVEEEVAIHEVMRDEIPPISITKGCCWSI